MSAIRTLLGRRRRPEMTSRYVGPPWEARRQRVLERLGVDLVIDVGANAGQYGCELRRHGYAGRMVSLEPASEAFARLVQTSRADDDWAARRLALGSAPGIASLNIAANEGKSSSFLPQRDVEFGTTATMRYVDTEQVTVTTLEDADRELCGDAERIYLKLDVQGLELDVIEGAGALLSRVVATETELPLLPLYDDQPGWRTICDRLDELGFVFYALDPGYSDWESGRLVEFDGLFVRADLASIGG